MKNTKKYFYRFLPYIQIEGNMCKLINNFKINWNDQEKLYEFDTAITDLVKKNPDQEIVNNLAQKILTELYEDGKLGIENIKPLGEELENANKQLEELEVAVFEFMRTSGVKDFYEDKNNPISLAVERVKKRNENN